MAASETKEKAEQLKNQANEFFKAEKYGQAVNLYTQVNTGPLLFLSNFPF
jgi:hypothetical protein